MTALASFVMGFRVYSMESHIYPNRHQVILYRTEDNLKGMTIYLGLLVL